MAGAFTIQTANLEKREKIALCQQNAWNFKYGRHCNGQITSCKNRATLGKERGNHILVGKIQCLNLIACNHYLGESAPSAEFWCCNNYISSSFFLPNAVQKAICRMFGTSWMVALGENMQVWTSNTEGVMKISMKVKHQGRSQSPSDLWMVLIQDGVQFLFKSGKIWQLASYWQFPQSLTEVV